MNAETIKKLLTEEKWTRTTVANYTIANFQELDTIIAPLVETDDQLEAKGVAEEHLQKNKNSIIALYIAGNIALLRHSLDYGHLTTLIEFFVEEKKWNIVEFLAQKILSRHDDRYVLRILADAFEKLDREEEKFELYERLIRVDYEETALIRTIAERYLAQDNNEKAIFYYKKGIQRYILAHDYAQVKDIWSLFLELIPGEFSYLLGIARRVADKMQPERAVQLLNILYEHLYLAEDWEKCVTTLKQILTYDSANQVARERLVEAYRHEYANHSRLESCLEISNLMQSYRDVHSAIEDFERNIAFDKGSFVFHKSWGIGRISDLNHTSVVIDFASKRNHKMSIQMAFNSLQILPKSHIWVLKSVIPKEKLTEKLKTDVEWGLRTLINSRGEGASLREMKAEISPSLLTASEWNTWSNRAKKILMENPMFGFLADDSDVYTVRDTPISYEEKTLSIFRGEKRFYNKVKIMRDFLASGDVESEEFLEMVNYFYQWASQEQVTDQVVASLLFLKILATKYNFVSLPQNVDFATLYQRLESKVETFDAIDDSELKKAYVDAVVTHEEPEQLEHILVALYPFYLTSYIMDILKEHAKHQAIAEMFRDACLNYRENGELFTYLARNYDYKYWEKTINVPFEMLVTSMLQLLDFAYNAIDARRQVTEHRKISRTLNVILFDERLVFTFLEQATREEVQRVSFIIGRIAALDQSKKIEVKHLILERFPNFEFFGDLTEEQEVISSGLLVTASKLKEKQIELDRIANIEIPENSKEIGHALSLGDLRENSEFKAAKERQEILNFTMGKLVDEISRATVVSQDMVDASKISFGTEVVLQNNLNDKKETYRILGPWESDPSTNTISYLAPFGAKLLNHVDGDQVAFEVNEQEYDFTVLSIAPLTL